MNRNYLDIFFGALAAWLIWKHLVRPKALMIKAKIKDYAKHLKHLHNMNQDIYSEETNKTILNEIQLCQDILKEKDKAVLKDFFQKSQEKIKTTIPPKKDQLWIDIVDLIVVPFSLVFAIRALFFQPFKIPTSSMQPTLHGVNLYYDDKKIVGEKTEYQYIKDSYKRPLAEDSNILRNFLNALYYGQAYADVEAKSSGTVNLKPLSAKEIAARGLGIPFLYSFSNFNINGQDHYLPIPAHKLKRELGNGDPNKKFYLQYSQGDKVFKGVSEDGDHLFVNRMIYNFRNPARGDIAVFMTNGITHMGGPLNGLFYIKRLVGMPGETLRIKQGRIFLVEDGVERALNKDDHPSFEKIYSGQGGYHGHLRRKEKFIRGKRVNYQGWNDEAVIPLNTGSYNSEGEQILTYGSYRFIKKEKFFEMENDIGLDYKFEEIDDNTLALLSPDDKRIFKLNKEKSHYNLFSITEIGENGYKFTLTEEYDEYTLGKGQYFMMGDNSSNSLDSRYWGPVPRQNIIGTALSVFWPFSHRWGMSDNYTPPENVKTIEAGKY